MKYNFYSIKNLIFTFLFLNTFFFSPIANSHNQTSFPFQISNGNAKIHYDKGLELYKKKKFSLAILELTKAININSKYAEAYNVRGHIYFDQLDFKKALLDYSKAIELSPKSNGAYITQSLRVIQAA